MAYEINLTAQFTAMWFNPKIEYNFRISPNFHKFVKNI